MISFKGRYFEKTIILMAVRWYVAYSLSYRNIEELIKERGLALDHATLQRWAVKYAPILDVKNTNGALIAVGEWTKPM